MQTMAEKRMFTQKIVDSDAFLDMPLSTQALYFHLNMRADDDGFINNPKRIQRTIGASEDDLKLLVAKRFCICFENGVIVIKHWRMHNTLRKDRYNPTQYQDEYKALMTKENNSYTENLTGNQVATSWQPSGNQLVPQYNLSKDKLSKDKVNKDISNSKIQRHKYGTYENVLLSDEEMEKLQSEFPYDWEERIERVSEYCASKGVTYKNYLATIRTWARKDRPRVVAKNDVQSGLAQALELLGEQNG
jgi:hypothetical protein